MRRLSLFVLCLLALASSACQSTAKPAWGSTATSTPPRGRVHRALLRAARDPQTWVPAAGSLLFGLTDWDEDVSDWAREQTPVFGSKTTADDASHALLASTGLLAVGTALATPSGMYEREIARNKAKGLAVEAAAAGATAGLTVLLKKGTQRTRPDGTDDEGFPSLHTSLAASFSAVNRRNAGALRMRPASRHVLEATSTVLATLTGWARIEAGAHHPSDVLAGYALGNFTTLLIHDAFLGHRADWCLEMGWRRSTSAFTLSIRKDL